MGTPITLVISEIVELNRIDEYEEWTKGINHAAQNFNGFLGVEVIRPRVDGHPEYVVIVKFDNYDNFRNWMTSSIYHKWLESSSGLVSSRAVQELPDGLEMWFSLPNKKLRGNLEPPYYKKVVLGTLAVYPLILFANALLYPFTKDWNQFLGLFISVVLVSALLTYPVMPW
jgi:antibiotic biosynthesis monooxygenase (ABM) superfamily enzyme